jgi:hypothetical protein
MSDVYNKVYSKKQLQELNYQLKENEYIVKIDEDTFMIEFEGQYDENSVYDEAEEKITSYYHSKFKNLGFSEEETKTKIMKMRKAHEIFGLQNALLDKYNINREISVKLPGITDEIIEEITPSKVMNMLLTYYGKYQLDNMDGEEREYEHAPKDYVLLSELYDMNKVLIDMHIANNDLADHFDNLLRKHLICKLLSEIII